MFPTSCCDYGVIHFKPKCNHCDSKSFEHLYITLRKRPLTRGQIDACYVTKNCRIPPPNTRQTLRRALLKLFKPRL